MRVEWLISFVSKSEERDWAKVVVKPAASHCPSRWLSQKCRPIRASPMLYSVVVASVSRPSRRAMVASSFGRASGLVQGHSAMQMPQEAASAK